MGLARKMSYLNSCLVLAALLLGGCTAGSGLLEPLAAAHPLSGNQLALPPGDIMKPADLSQAADQEEEIEVSGDVPTLASLNAFVQPGIDPPTEAKILEQDTQSAAVDLKIKWRGRVSADGIDLANVNGVLCSSPNPARSETFTVQIACSDGRMGKLSVNSAEAQIAFGANTESAQLEKLD